jgi:hypothetical protein
MNFSKMIVPYAGWKMTYSSLGDLKMVGPFDFHQRRMGLKGAKRKAVSVTHHVDDIFWKAPETKAPQFGICVDNLRISPS